MANQPPTGALAQSLLPLGETVTLERFAGTESSGGYHTETYHDPVEVDVLLRPGEIDVPFVDTTGQQGTADWWMMAPSSADVGEDDRVTRKRDFGAGGFGDQQFGTGSTFEVSMPRPCPVHGLALYQLDEIDSRR
jgi:hypothetical protein